MPRSLKRIMHIDDDSVIRQITAQALEVMGGYDIKSCSSGQEALESFEDFHPELILVDMVMPGMEGPEAVQALREEGNVLDVPVIFVTGKEAESIDLNDMTFGVIGMIKKPYKPAELLSQISDIWQNHYS